MTEPEKPLSPQVDTTAIFRSVNARGENSPLFGDAIAWLRAALAAIPPNSTWTTRQLLTETGFDTLAPADKKRIGQTLWYLRKSGKVEDCYRLDPSRRYMGNPLVMWRRPSVASIREEDF
jgi:hypothetical protein